jgi:hypothetical protein
MEAGGVREVTTVGDFIVYWLMDADLNPASAYDGDWALETSLDDQVIELRAFAAIPDKQMYVMVPQVASLDWRVQLTGLDGETSVSDVYPSNAVLLYHGSDRWLRMQAPLPAEARGQYVVTLINNINGKVLAERVLFIPEEC